MKHLKLAILATAGLLTASAAAQAQPQGMEPPKPGAEHQRLGYFVGEWRSEGEAKEGPWGPGGKLTGEARCRWMSGGFFVVCDNDGSGPLGKMYGLGVMGYDAEAKSYTWNGFNSMGENETAKGSLEGKTWTYVNENAMGDTRMQGRYSMTEKSPTAYAYKFETSTDGRTWTTLMEGTVTKK
jgi:hypothetical protein